MEGKKSFNGPILLILVLILFGIIGFFYYSFVQESSIENFEDEEQNVGSEVKTIEVDYSSLGIDPNKYETFTGFLEDFETFTGVDVKVTKEDFVICEENEDGSTTYTPFRQGTIASSMVQTKEAKNEAIADVYTAYKNDCLAGSKGSSASNIVLFEEDIAHPESSTINGIYSKEIDINRLIKELETVGKNSKNKKELLSYLYEFRGDYEEAAINRVKNCKEDEKLCNKEVKFTFRGEVKDEEGKPIEGAKVTFLNNTKAQVNTDEDGTFSMSFKYYPFSHLRFKASIEGYSDGFITISFNTYEEPEWDNTKEEEFVLHKAHKTYSVDTSSTEYIVTEDGKDYYMFKTEQSTYWLPVDALFYEDGSLYEGKRFNVYLYEFNKQSNMENLLNNDTFNPVYGYVGNIMKTFGMPYIQFIDQDTGEELFVKSSNPMRLQNQIYHMKELYENYDQIYEALTEEDMEWLVEVSEQEGGYPIDFQWLTENEFLRWPAWWVLDRKKGIWENIGCKVINVDGLVELPFYSIND